jgi:hypothetical protein
MKRKPVQDESLIKQSKTALNQWGEQWRAHAKEHSKYKQKPMSDFLNIGVGKAVLCVANGYSTEEEMETIKKYQHNVDILCCDKSLGHLIRNGIYPTYCLVCDANVDYEVYLKPYEDKLQKTTLFMNVCANPLWTRNGNWKDMYFFVNRDVIQAELEFMKLSGCQNTMAAGTNVSNAMIIALTQSDNESRRNWFGYDKILLIGFDYSWRADGNYYAYDKDGGGKSSYMRHMYFSTMTGKFAYSSGNLVFSKDWLQKYIESFNLPVVQCSKDSLLQTKHKGQLAYQMQYRYKTEDAATVKKLISELNTLQQQLLVAKKRIDEIGRDHYKSFAASS